MAGQRDSVTFPILSQTRRPMRGLAGAIAAAVLGLAGTATAAPTFLRLSYTGDTTTSMSVTWNTTVAADSVVKYGTSPGNLTDTATGTSSPANAGLGIVHEVTLANLQPSTIYYYVAGSDTDGYSAEKPFMSGPVQDQNCGEFMFAFLGDNRPDPIFGGGENWPEILGQTSVHLPRFILNGGDLVIDGDQIDQWLDFLGWTETVADSIPFMPAIGNHDTGPGTGDTANYNQLFSLPRSTGTHGSNTEDYYYFTFGNAIMVTLSTEGFKTGSTAFADQAAWLDEVLTNNPRKWKFVYYHKPTYTHEVLFSISHEPNEENQNAAFVPIFDKHHVDVVFTSHNHWYERYEPSACGNQGNPGSDQPCSVGAGNFANGTVYVVSGGAGAFTIPGWLCGNQSGRARCSGDHHYILVSIRNETLTMDTWGAYPQANQIIDSVTITKPADVCTPPPDAGVPDAATDGGPGPDAGTDSSPQPDAPTDAQTGNDGSTPPSDGGSPQTDGTSPQPDGGSSQPDGGTSAPSAVPDASSDGGCGCRATPRNPSGGLILLGSALAGLLWHRRRKNRGRAKR